MTRPPQPPRWQPGASRLRIALIAPCRFPIREPFAGGLEAYVWTLGHALIRHGHEVTLFAAVGSDEALNVVAMPPAPESLARVGRRDIDSDLAFDAYENDVYADILDRIEQESFDVVHNHSLHPTPITGGAQLDLPVVSTLHTPPFPTLSSAVARTAGTSVSLAAVSWHTARLWRRHVRDLPVISNGVDIARWRPGPGGGPLVWSGRLVPEKAPHLAIDAARRAGMALVLAGPAIDRSYVDREVMPRLGPDVRYLGHLDQVALSQVVRRSSAALVTPQWDEPYGLVVAEALASGTPVVAFSRGGIPEILDRTCGVLVEAGDVDGLAVAIPRAQSLSRRAARRRAEQYCSLERMVAQYEQLYLSVLTEAA